MNGLPTLLFYNVCEDNKQWPLSVTVKLSWM